MSYLITCKNCRFNIATEDPKRVNFCAGCGGFLKIENADGEQPFHLPEGDPDISKMADKNIVDINELLSRGIALPPNLQKALAECVEILKELSGGNSANRDQTDEMLDKFSRDAKKRKKSVKNRIIGEELSILDDEKWFQKLKKLKF